MSKTTNKEMMILRERSSKSRWSNDSSTESISTLPNIAPQNSTARSLTDELKKSSNDNSTSSSASESTSSESEPEPSQNSDSANLIKYDVEPITPIAIASLIVPSVERIKPCKEYSNISSLFVEPQKVVFTTKGGRSNHILINESNVRLAIKVRCSNNKFFRVYPVYMFLDSGTMNELEVLRLPGGDAGIDQLLLCYVVAKDDDNDVKALFTLATKLQWIAITLSTRK
uniref:Major sperm protein n=1 Tax=Parascaris univalens TaxID=6257 RepID=A0A915B3E3_PARUN